MGSWKAGLLHIRALFSLLYLPPTPAVHNNSFATSPTRWLYCWLTAAFTLAGGKWRRWGGHARLLRSSSFWVFGATLRSHWALCFPSLEDAPVQQTSAVSDLKPGEAHWKPKEACFITLHGVFSTSNAAFYMDESDLQITFPLLSVPKFPALPLCTITMRFAKCDLVVFGAPFVVDLAEKWTAEETETLCWMTAVMITVYFSILWISLFIENSFCNKASFFYCKGLMEWIITIPARKNQLHKCLN